jgi:hypothetical protein
MPYQIVEEHDEGATLKEIAEAGGVDFSRGLGYYELVKKEKVSAKKQLVLWAKGKVVSEDSAEVLRRCGLRPNADNDIKPSDIPAGHKLFVQSTSPNRKIPEDAAALFVVDAVNDADGDNGDDEDPEVAVNPSKRQKTEAEGEAKEDWALDIPRLSELLDGKDEDDLYDLELDDLTDLFKKPIGTMFADCDARVPQPAQAAAVNQLAQLFRVQWDEKSIVVTINKKKEIAKAKASGILEVFPEDPTDRYGAIEEVPVSIYFTLGVPLFAVSIGNKWACMLGSASAHPFVWSTDVNYDNSDGSSNQDSPKALPAAATKMDQLNALFAYNIKWFSLHCSDYNH